MKQIISENLDPKAAHKQNREVIIKVISAKYDLPNIYEKVSILCVTDGCRENS